MTTLRSSKGGDDNDGSLKDLENISSFNMGTSSGPQHPKKYLGERQRRQNSPLKIGAKKNIPNNSIPRPVGRDTAKEIVKCNEENLHNRPTHNTEKPNHESIQQGIDRQSIMQVMELGPQSI